MANDPNKNEEQQKEGTTSTATTTPTTESKEVTMPEINLEEKYKEATKLLEESNNEAVDAITKSYGTQETAMGELLKEAETLRGEKQRLDEKAQKRANAYRYITGIGDAVSGIANLVGTTLGAVNQEQHYNAPAVIQKAEASRKERKLEMDTINERIKELKAQKGALAATKEMKLGEQRAKYAAEKASLELQKAEDELGLAKTAINAGAKVDVAKIRGQYQVETQETKNDGKTTSPKPGALKDVHPFDFGNGKGVNIADHLWTDAAIESVYQLIPEEERTKRAKFNQFGSEVVIDGKTQYEKTTKDDKVADIVRAAKTNPEVQKKLQAIARGSIFERL